jgi:uncharacterized membrane protein YkoI
MKNKWIRKVLFVGLIATGVASIALAVSLPVNFEVEASLPLAECPKAVQKTIEREARGAKVDKVDIESKNDMIVFEADAKIGQANYEILVAVDGTLISKRLDEEDESAETEVKFADCPADVQKTLTSEAEGATIKGVDKFMKEGRWLFETDVAINGKNYEIIVAESGFLLSKKLDNEE